MESEVRLWGQVIDAKDCTFRNAPLFRKSKSLTQKLCYICNCDERPYGSKLIKILGKPEQDPKDFNKYIIPIYYFHEECVLTAILKFKNMDIWFNELHGFLSDKIKEDARDEAWEVVEERLNGPR